MDARQAESNVQCRIFLGTKAKDALLGENVHDFDIRNRNEKVKYEANVIIATNL